MCLAGSAGDEQRVRVAAEAPDRAQRDVAYDTRNAEARFVEQSTGQSLIRSKIGTDYARKIVDRAANLPALDHLFYGQEAAARTGFDWPAVPALSRQRH